MTKIFRHKKVVFLTGIMISVTFLISCVSILLLYNNAQNDLYNRLTDIVNRDKAGIILWLNKYNKTENEIIEHLKSVRKNNAKIGKTGEIIIAKFQNDSLIFIVPDKPQIEHFSLIELELASPLQKALKKENGIMKGKGHKGDNVFAAYNYIDELNWGIVAEIPTKEINKPYIYATIIVFTLALLLVSISTFLFLKITNPIIDESEKDKIELVNKNKQLQQANSELTKAKEKAEESDRLKTAFLANISHEIRTPMNSILGFSDLLSKQKFSQEEKNDFIKKIQNNGKQLLAIIDDLIDISKIESNLLKFEQKPVDINYLLLDIYTIFEYKNTNPNIDFSFSKSQSDFDSNIITDSVRLQQILTNLIANAFKFTPMGSIRFGYVLKNTVIEFFVEDTGIGIAKEDQEIIFERFRQLETELSRNYGGSGLGLAISKALVNALGGTIWVNSELEKGTTFYFTIPYIPVYNEPINTSITSSDKKISIKKRKTILIAEDVDDNYIYFQDLLSDLDIELIHAKNGKEAIEKVLQNPTIDLVLMDVKMPVLDGYKATKEIKKHRKDLPIIIQTAYAQIQDKELAFQNGCDDYISKPINEEKLIELLKRYI